MADINYKFLDKGMNVTTLQEHKKALRDRDGGISEHIDQDLQETENASAQAKINRARRRQEAARQANKAMTEKAVNLQIAKDNEKGEAAAARREYEKEDEAYKKRKEAFDRMVEERKAQKSRA